jgi:hypothetical protein
VRRDCTARTARSPIAAPLAQARAFTFPSPLFQAPLPWRMYYDQMMSAGLTWIGMTLNALWMSRTELRGQTAATIAGEHTAAQTELHDDASEQTSPNGSHGEDETQDTKYASSCDGLGEDVPSTGPAEENDSQDAEVAARDEDSAVNSPDEIWLNILLGLKGPSLNFLADQISASKQRAISFWQDWEANSDEENLVACIEAHMELLELLSVNDPNRARWCRNLSVALEARYELTGNSTFLDQTIECKKEALHLS